jgi:hypothetical protein
MWSPAHPRAPETRLCLCHRSRPLAGVPHFGSLSTYAADLVALKLNVLHTRYLNVTTGTSPAKLEDGAVSSLYGIAECSCRTGERLLDG